MYRNQSGQRLYVFAYGGADHASPGDPVTGDAANITAQLSLDGAAPAATNDVNPTEVGGGVYAFDLTQAETDADEIMAVAASSTANVQAMTGPIYTRGFAKTPSGGGGLGPAY